MNEYNFPLFSVGHYEDGPAYVSYAGKIRNYDDLEAITISEATALSFGLYPGLALEFVDSDSCDVLARCLYYSREDELIRAVCSGTIRAAKLDSPDNKQNVTPETLVLTSDVKRYLGGKIESNNSDAVTSGDAETEPTNVLHDTERKSMLKLIIGMAIDAYGYDPESQRNEATGANKNSIKAKLEAKGISMNDDTIRKYLNEAKAVLKDD